MLSQNIAAVTKSSSADKQATDQKKKKQQIAIFHLFKSQLQHSTQISQF